MRCWKCGAQISDMAKFCPECGTPQNGRDKKETVRPAYDPERDDRNSQSRPISPQERPVTPPVTPNPPKKKKGGFLITLVIVLICYAGGRLLGTGMAQDFLSSRKTSSTSVTTSPRTTAKPSPSPKNSAANTVNNSSSNSTEITVPELSLRRVFFQEDADGCKTYQAVHFGMTSKIITGITYSLVLDKSYGYTEESVRSGGFLENYFPAFAVSTFFDDGDYLVLRIVTDKLDDPARMQQMVDKELVILADGATQVTSGGIDAEGYMQSILDAGGRAASTDEVSTLHLN